MFLCASVIFGAPSANADSPGAAPPGLPVAEAKSGKAWGESRNEGLTLRINRLACRDDAIAVLTLRGPGLVTRRVASDTGCDFLNRLERIAIPGDGKPYVPWRGWRVWFDESTAAGCDLPPWEEITDVYLRPCSALNIARTANIKESQVLKWSLAVNGVVARSGVARFARVEYRKSRPARKLTWFRFPRNSVYWNNETGPAPSGWWACRNNKRSRYWERPTYKPALSGGTELYGYWIYCQPPRLAARYKTDVKVLP